MGNEPQGLVAHLTDLYSFLDRINPVNSDFPAWAIEKGRPHQCYPGTHPRLKFKIGVNLTPLPDVLDILATRETAWNIEEVLRQKLPDGGFYCADDVRKVYEVTECGLIFPEYDLLEKEQKDSLTVSKIEYNALRETHSKTATAFLKKIRDAGKLHDAYIAVGDMGGPEEKSFFDQKGFYLRPPVLLNFLSGKNRDGGPEDFGLRYSVELRENESAFHEFNLKYNPKGKVLTIEDWGLWKLDNKRRIYLNPQPPAEHKVREDSPLVKLLESFRK